MGSVGPPSRVAPSLRVGTRGSPLALTQTQLVVRALQRRTPGLRIEVKTVTTQGDRSRRPRGSPDFTGAIEDALREGRIDAAVHSAKDLPAEDPTDLVIAAYPRRADVRDCWIANDDRPLPLGARVGTSSVRRIAQLHRWRPDLKVCEVRGNVGTRIRLSREGRVDAVVLAKAGVERLGRAGEVSGVLSLRWFLPSPGQAALAVQTRADDPRARSVVRTIDHRPTRAAVEAERCVAETLGASCNVPLGTLARVGNGRLSLSAEVLSTDGARTVRSRMDGSASSARNLGRRLGVALERAGARALLG